ISLFITIFLFLYLSAVVFDCHFLFTVLASLCTPLAFLSPALCQCSCTAVLITPAYPFLLTFSFHCTTSYIFCASPLIHFCFPLLFFSPLQVLTLYLKSILFLVVLLLELLPPPHPSILH